MDSRYEIFRSVTHCYLALVLLTNIIICGYMIYYNIENIVMINIILPLVFNLSGVCLLCVLNCCQPYYPISYPPHYDQQIHPSP